MFTHCDADGIGDRIKRARKRRGLTQEVLAERIDVERNTISMIETGKREPSLDVLVKIMNQLRVEPNEFFCSDPYDMRNDRTSSMVRDIVDVIRLYEDEGPPEDDE